jgi:hypothetical protein
VLKGTMALSSMQVLLGITCLSLGGLFTGLRASADPKQPEQIAVQAEPAFEVFTTRGKFLRVKYRYKAVSNQPIRVRGIGLVPSQGEQAYLTQSDSIEFLDASSNTLLLRFPLGEPVRMMGPNTSLQSPQETDFGQAARPGAWAGPKERFTEAVRAVFAKRFPLGYFAYESRGENHYLTTYAELPGVGAPKIAQVAVLATHSAAPPGAAVLSFMIKVRGREKLSHTKWQDKLGPDATKALGAFQNALATEIEALGTAAKQGASP